MISEKLSAIYTKAEDAFFGVIDWLDQKGIPVYNVVDFFEDKGIPFFPLTVALIVLLFGLIIGLLLVSGSVNPSLNLFLQDDQGNALNAVSITIVNLNNNQTILGPRILNNNASIELENISIGTRLKINAQKQNFDDATSEVLVDSEILSDTIELRKIIRSITGKLKLFDSKTNTPIIEGVTVFAEWGFETRYATLKGNVFSLSDLPFGEEVKISVVSDSYEQAEFFKTFTDSESVEELQLVRKIAAFEGNSNLVINVLDKDSKELIKNARIQIFDDSTDSKISDIISESGLYVESLPKGTVVRIVVEAENYIKFDASIEGILITLANDEHEWNVELEKGGEKLRVNVKNIADRLPIVGAIVELHNSLGELIDSDTTAFAGFAEFSDLNINEDYYITAFKQNFLPSRIKITPLALESVDIELIRAGSSNSAVLNVQVAGADRNPANNAILKFFEIKEEEILPLGIPSQKTGFDGKHTLTMPLGVNILVKAVKGLEQGEEEILIESGINNLTIQLIKPLNVKTLLLKDENGNLISNARVVISTPSGTVLFDKVVGEGEEIIFDADAFSQLDFLVETSDGKSFTQTLDVSGTDGIELVVDTANEAVSNSPEISFLGIFSLNGEKIDGLSIGEEAYLRFETVWPESSGIGGMHIRLGNDSVKYVDSQFAGISGFDVFASSFSYGTSYNAFPSPGNEAIDLANKGRAGEFNKWLELEFNSPNGTKIVNVKVKTRENISQNKIELHYRNWIEENGVFFRNPMDSELENDFFTSNKTALYADAHIESLNVYTSKPLCKDELCVSYVFVNELNETIKTEDFKALKGKVFALELQISSNRNENISVKAFTDLQNQLLSFTGIQVNAFSDLINNENNDSSLELSNVTIARDAFTKLRFNFKPFSEGSSFIRAQAISSTTSVSEDFYFNIFEAKKMIVQLPSQVELQENFEILIKDEQGIAVSNASISFFDSSNNLLYSIIGNNSEGKGLGGRYGVENAFDAGTLNVKIKAELFEPFNASIQISRSDVLKVEEEIKVSIPKGQQSFSKRSSISNDSSETISNISYSIEKNHLFPAELDLSLSIPQVLNSGQSQPMDVTAKFLGNAEENFHGEAIVSISGSIAGKYSVNAKTKVIIDYNKKFDSDCLESDKPSLKAYLVGELGSFQNVDLTLKNNCETTLALTVLSSPLDETIDISAGALALKPGEQKTIKINLANKIKRVNFQLEEKKFDLVFSSNELTKSIPLTVVLWNELFALQTNENIVMFLTQSTQGGTSIGSTPLFIKNTGFEEITNLTISFDRAQLQGAEVRIVPTTQIASLKPNESVNPPILIEATANSAINGVIKSEIIISGRIKGKDFELRRIPMFLNISQGFGGLIATCSDCLFEADESNFGIISKRISIKNNTLEPVRIIAVEPRNLGTNLLALEPKVSISPGQEIPSNLILAKNQDFSSTTKIRIIGIGTITGSPINSELIPIQIAIGKLAFESFLTSTNEVEVPICGNEEQTLTVKFPLISNGDCSKGYCDAVGLANFLAQKLNAKAEEARSQVYQLKNEISNSSCNAFAASCSFSSLGIQSQSFDVFFSNDNLSDSLMRSSLQNGAFPLIRNALVQERNIRTELQLASSFFGTKAVYIPSNFEGCGLYKAKIIGTVQNVNGRLVEEGTIMAVSLQRDKIDTPECSNKIQNFPNFLPEDKGLTKSSRQGSWLGMIEYSSDLKELAERISQSMYSTKDRATTNAPNNVLDIHSENVEDYLLRLEIDKSGSSSSPKTVRAIINQQFEDSDSAVRKDIAEQVASTISNLYESNIDPEKACIGEDESFIQLKYSPKLAGGIVISGENSIKLLPIPACSELKIKTKIREKLTIENSLISSTKGLNDGDVWLQKERNGSPNETISFNEDDLEIDSETGDFFKEFFVCSKSSSTQLRFAQNQKIKVSGFSSENTQRKSNIFELTANVCAIDPVNSIKKAVNRFNNGDKSPFYQTDVWKGSKQISLDELRKLLSKEGVITLNEDGSINDPLLYTPVSTSRRLVGTLGYTLTCTGACGVCATTAATILPALGVKSGLECLTTCGVIGLYEVAKVFGVDKEVTAVAGDIWEETKQTFSDLKGGETRTTSPASSLPGPSSSGFSTSSSSTQLFGEGVVATAGIGGLAGVRDALTPTPAATATATAGADAAVVRAVQELSPQLDEFAAARNSLKSASWVWDDAGTLQFRSPGRTLTPDQLRLLRENFQRLIDKGFVDRASLPNTAPRVGATGNVKTAVEEASRRFVSQSKTAINPARAFSTDTGRLVANLEAELDTFVTTPKGSPINTGTAKAIGSNLESSLGGTGARPTFSPRLASFFKRFGTMAVCGTVGAFAGQVASNAIVRGGGTTASQEKIVVIEGDGVIENGATYKVNISKDSVGRTSVNVSKLANGTEIEQEKLIFDECTEKVFERELKTV